MKTVKLSDVCDISSGGTPSRNNPEFFKGDIPWAKISDIEAAYNGFIYTTDECITADGLKNIRGKLFPKGTLLFAMYGSIGKVAFAGTELSANQAILGIRPKVDAQIDLKYLKCWFESNKQRLINQGQGVALKNLSATIVRNLEIELPPLDDQKRIAHLLGKVEGLIARRKQHLQQLDDLLKSVFLEMFGDHTAMKQQQHFLLGDFIDFLTSGSRGWAKYYSDTGDIFLRINNVKDGRLKLDDVVYVNAPASAEANRTRVRSGDLLLSITADLGRTAVIPKELDGSYINQHLALIRIKEEAGFNPIFLAWYFSLPYGKSFIQKKNREGVKAGLNFDDIRSFQVVKPSIAHQNQFAAIIKKVDALKSRYQQSLTDLESLYGALSQKAFKGELDLSRVVLPAEEPEIAEGETTDIEEKQPMEPLFELPAPEELALLRTSEGRKALLGEWLNAWLEQLSDAPFATQAFMDAARQRLWELAEDDAPEWGAAEYDELKTQVFEALEQGRLIQGYDDDNNRVQIIAAKG
ncbi:hypothetical protein B1757_08165 [Acidithiobacillus marinus]|uniref:Type I restriction modification DNA specificity domain-containing protein n=1 Tax=Acidithiobacillus marinus TaxID=187490 RepID=A0A2I1DKY9_9PROT|nr:restriction endonuclease subunit S [Acidithiobacillus marinus]PKY10549.1 hypothetical protein B1757_08165 [Acidithiobacillus marinus]